jgi:RND family efflux transporter MFP subunit
LRAVRTEKVVDATAQPQTEFAAEVRARTESRLGFRVGGKLVAREVEVGQRVRAGQVLARLDPRDLSLAEDAARAALQAADLAAAQAGADLQRYRELHGQGFIGAAELQRRETEARAALARRDQARAQAAAQVNQAAYSQLLAPADGVVTAVEAEPGTVLAAGTPVIRLAHAGPRDVVFAVPEDAVSGFRGRVGSPVQVRLWGSSATMSARVREVAAAADAVTRTFQVKADLGTAPAELGQTATVTATQPPVPGLARLPLSALREHQGRTSVWVLDPASMTVRARAVQVSGADGNVALVTAGLSPGDEVVTAGVHVLSEGQKVTRYGATAVPAVPASAPPASAASR